VRLGSTREVRIDVRLVAATNRDLAREVEAGRFRQDLFYRLNVVPIRLPSLRERREDVHPLTLHFLNRANQAHQRNIYLSPEAHALLEQHAWPGNVRELGNVIERLVLLAPQPLVQASDVARYLDQGGALLPSQQSPSAPMPAEAAPAPAPAHATDWVREYRPAHSHSIDTLLQALAQHQGNQSRAAQSLGLTLRQFAYRLKKARPAGT
jgi:Nif-specific regulatory protein